MKKKNVNSSANSITFWKPKKAGEKISGVFQSFTSSEFGKGKKIQKVMSVNISDGGTTYGVTISTVLKSAFKKIYFDLKSGKSKLEIVYGGKKKGKKYNIFTVFFNGKEVITSGLREPAKSEEVSAFFDGE